jgi:hypothetical protein
MYAETVEGKWQQYQGVAHALWDPAAGTRSGVDAGSPVQFRTGSLAETVRQSRIIPKILGGLLILTVILAATYLAAATLVEGAASHSQTRAQRSMVLQQAAANYRLARAQCQSVSADNRGACITEAHAEEDRARAVAPLAPRNQVAALRFQTDAAIDAGDHDSIVVEPACNVVARGQASVCEIQVKSNTANLFAAAVPPG